MEVEVKPLARVTLYIFTPCLIFSSLVETTLGKGDIFSIMFFCFLWITALSVIMYLICRAMKFTGQIRSAMLLSGIFPNAGNYGLPIVLFALGQAGFARAIIFQVAGLLFLTSYGVFIASSGKENLFKSLKAVFTMPALYAFAAGFAINMLSLEVADSLFRSVNMLGQAAIPSDLLLLGMQLSKLKVQGSFRLIGLASSFRLLLSPVIALILLWILFDPQSLTAKVLLIQTAAPVAVIANVLAIQFDARPEVVVGATFVATIVSLVTLPILLSFVI